jgi:hypothetical protein
MNSCSQSSLRLTWQIEPVVAVRPLAFEFERCSNGFLFFPSFLTTVKDSNDRIKFS